MVYECLVRLCHKPKTDKFDCSIFRMQFVGRLNFLRSMCDFLVCSFVGGEGGAGDGGNGDGGNVGSRKVYAVE